MKNQDEQHLDLLATFHYVVGAILKNDFPAVMGVTLFLATMYLTINLVIDLLYFVVDPRLRAS